METELQSRVDGEAPAESDAASEPGIPEAADDRGKALVISIHIPKTAGTTLASVLDYAVNRRVLYDYRNLVPADPKLIPEALRYLKDLRLIHGHFHYAKYGSIYPDARYLTVLRDPIERTVSNYFHLMRSRDPVNKNYRLIEENNLDLVGFSELPGVGNAQTRFVHGRAIKDYTLVGLTEDMGATVKLIRKLLDLPAYHPTVLGRLGFVPKTNVGYGRLLAQFKHGFVTPAVKEKVRQNVAEDWHLYEEAKARFTDLKKEHL